MHRSIRGGVGVIAQIVALGLTALLIAAAPIEPSNPGPLWFLFFLDALLVVAIVASRLVVFDTLRSTIGRPMYSGTPS